MNPAVFRRVQRAFAATLGAVAALALAGCISVSLEVPGDPLSPDQLRARIETRQFAADFTERVTRAADAIAQGTQDAGVRANTLRWKIGASVASRRAPPNVRAIAIAGIAGGALFTSWAWWADRHRGAKATS